MMAGVLKQNDKIIPTTNTPYQLNLILLLVIVHMITSKGGGPNVHPKYTTSQAVIKYAWNQPSLLLYQAKKYYENATVFCYFRESGL